MASSRKRERQATAVQTVDSMDRIAAALRPLAVPVAELTADPANVRRHAGRNLQAIVASLEAFGQQAPVVYVRQGGAKVVIKGNGVLVAARSLGWSHLAAAASGLTGRAATAYAIADNRTTDLSEFDEALLAAQLQDLEEAEFDIAAAGFSDEELQDLIESVEEPPGAPGRPAGPAERKRHPRVMGFTLGQFHFEIPRQAYDAWVTTIEDKCGEDVDQVVKEIKRRLRL